jgi:hypothetical protein
MREEIVAALRQHFEAHVTKHATNIKIMLDVPMSIPEHTGFMESIEAELAHIAEYQDKLEALDIVLNK